MSFLDVKFPTFESLVQNIDSETIRLREERKKTEEERKRLEEVVAKNVKACEERVKMAFANPDPKAGRNEIEAAFSTYPELNREKVQQSLDRIEELRSLAKVLRAVQQVTSIEQTIQCLVSSQEDNNKQIVQSFCELKLVYETLGKHVCSNNSTVRGVAALARQQIEEGVFPKVRKNIDQQLAGQLETSGWPKRMPESLGFFELFENSLRLELPIASKNSLFTFDILARAINIRIQYNFASGRETEQHNKPDWLSAYLFQQFDVVAPWLMDKVQGSLASVLPGKSAIEEFANSVQPTLFSTLERYFVSAQNQPHALGLLVEETASIVSALKENYFVVMQSLPATLLQNTGLLNVYIQSEHDALLATMKDVIGVENLEYVDFDSNESLLTQPTVAAIKVRQLLEDSATSAYKLGKIDVAEIYVRNVSLPALAYYHEHLLNMLSRFVSTSSAFIGSAERKKFSGMTGTMYLGSILAASAYIYTFLRSLSCELVFIDISDKGEDVLLSFRAQFSELRAAAIKHLVSHITNDLSLHLRDYFVLDWEHFEVVAAENEASPQLVRARLEIDKMLMFVRRLCGPADELAVTTSFSDSVASLLMTRAVHASRFSALSARQLGFDINDLWDHWSLPKTQNARKLFGSVSILAGAESCNSLDQENISKLRRRRLDLKDEAVVT